MRSSSTPEIGLRSRAPEWTEGPVADLLGRVHLSSRREGGAGVARSSFTVMADARLDAPPPGNDQDPSPEARIGAALEAQGSEAIDHLIGDFAFGAWTQDTLILGRDSMSMRPLYYRDDGGRVEFSSRIGPLLPESGVPEVHVPAVAAFLAGASLPSDRSFFEDVVRVPPGTALRFGAGGLEGARHRQPEAPPVSTLDEEAATAELWARLRLAVAERIRGRRAGLMLSGGADSSAIAVAISELDPGERHRAMALTWSFQSLRRGDETETARWVADRSGLPLREVPGDDAWPLRGPRMPRPDLDSPFIWPFRALNDRTLDAAKEYGADVVLTGDRGDYVVGDWVYGDGRTVGAPPLPPFLSTRVREEARALRDAAAPSVDDPTGELRRARIASWAGGQIAEMNHRAYRARGVDYADPWADVRIADFVAALPPHWVNREDEPKRILLRALSGRGLDPERLTSRSPDDLFEKGLRREETDAVRALWRRSVAGDLGLVDPHVLRDTFEAYVASGTMAFDLWKPIALELWLRRIHDGEDSP
ncbi:MAG: hypothetical protein HKN73_12890 [Gemmatimonadetes bacterium]|nr:hypothetical protein [Gemmatimonadota bacterium]